MAPDPRKFPRFVKSNSLSLPVYNEIDQVAIGRQEWAKKWPKLSYPIAAWTDWDVGEKHCPGSGRYELVGAIKDTPRILLVPTVYRWVKWNISWVSSSAVNKACRGKCKHNTCWIELHQDLKMKAGKLDGASGLYVKAIGCN